jgi:hypothetical protein
MVLFSRLLKLRRKINRRKRNETTGKEIEGTAKSRV